MTRFGAAEPPQVATESLTCLELCAGGGGQALGLEQAGYEHLMLVEIDAHACETLRQNRPSWRVVQADLKSFDDQLDRPFGQDLDLLAGGVPCPPFSVAGHRLGQADDRDLFPAALDIVERLKPRAVMLENVRGLLDPRFDTYRAQIGRRLEMAGYRSEWKLLHASDFGVPQLRPRAICVALKPEFWPHFAWPNPTNGAPSVGEALLDLMTERGWPGARDWGMKARAIAPTIVGGSKKHGGPDLGPTRARRQWASLGVNGLGIAAQSPDVAFPPNGMPQLTIRMVARLQGFPDSWKFAGKKTAAYRQIGNAFPPPAARAVGNAIARALKRRDVLGARQLELAEASA
jgi:DNA (cytosine-5)-methyltransferase 1